MKKFILVYELAGYPEDGGGTYVEYAEDLQGLEDLVNKLVDEHKQDFYICFAGEIRQEIEFKAVEIVKKWQIKK